MNYVITGDKEIAKALEAIENGSQNAIVRPAMQKAARVAVKYIKSKIPSRYKDVRKSIGQRVVKTRYTKGNVVVKIGASVGKRKEQKKKERTGKRGVGISTTNIHWWFFGTRKRFQGIKYKYRNTASGKVLVGAKRTGNPVRDVGAMPIMEDPIAAILAPQHSRMREIMTQEIQQRIIKLALKKRAKAGK